MPEFSGPQILVLVPTCNPGPKWNDFLQALHAQTLRSTRCIVIDSESSDGAVQAAQAMGIAVHNVARANFNHGTTRQQAVDLFASNADIVVFLTQDALLADPGALEKLVSVLDDPSIGAAYGRQLPHADATPVAAHARLFNYPGKGHIRSLADVPVFGIKTCFLSNSFAAYRVTALREVGGFPSNVILGEDMHTSARMLTAGYSVAYSSQAAVYHSHNYSLLEDFCRSFDTGVFHAQQPWLIRSFGAAGREGVRFVCSEMAYLLRKAPWRMPEAAIRTMLKALAYRLGCHYVLLPSKVRRSLSMHKGYWT